MNKSKNLFNLKTNAFNLDNTFWRIEDFLQTGIILSVRINLTAHRSRSTLRQTLSNPQQSHFSRCQCKLFENRSSEMIDEPETSYWKTGQKLHNSILLLFLSVFISENIFYCTFCSNTSKSTLRENIYCFHHLAIQHDKKFTLKI